MTAVVGLDLSLTATGVATTAGEVVISSKLKGMARIAAIDGRIWEHVGGVAPMMDVDLVVIEGYSFGSRNSQAHALGELGGVVRMALHTLAVPYIDVPPSTLKVFATGKGNAGKDEVLAAAIRRLGFGGHDNNAADALWLRALGHHVLGDPLLELPASHTRALDKVRPLLEGTAA